MATETADQGSSNNFKLTLTFDGADELTTSHGSIVSALVDVMALFEDCGSDTLPCECRVNMHGQISELTISVGGTLSTEVFPLVPTEFPLLSARIIAIRTNTTLDTTSYPLAEGLETRNGKTAFAEINGEVVTNILYARPTPGIEKPKAKFEASQQMQATGRVLLGEIRGARFFPRLSKGSR